MEILLLLPLLLLFWSLVHSHFAFLKKPTVDDDDTQVIVKHLFPTKTSVFSASGWIRSSPPKTIYKSSLLLVT